MPEVFQRMVHFQFLAMLKYEEMLGMLSCNDGIVDRILHCSFLTAE